MGLSKTVDRKLSSSGKKERNGFCDGIMRGRFSRFSTGRKETLKFLGRKVGGLQMEGRLS